jgi:uncharacterized protein (TIGR03118 family)
MKKSSIALCALQVLVWSMSQQRMNAATGYVQHNLASDVPLLADFTDPNLVNPWGVAISPFWVCNNGTGTFVIEGTNGQPTAVVDKVASAPGNAGPGRCTGVTRNPTAGLFGGTWIVATEDGTISVLQGNQTVIKVDNSAAGAVYKGLAIATTAAGSFIFAANFNAGTIDVYDSNYAKAALAGSFADPTVPAGFAPFNIQNLGGKLYVAYAKQNAAKTVDVGGAGNGYVAAFDTSGNLLAHLISNGPLNSPWGLGIAPPSFGTFANDLLVGNFRDGTINAFDPSTGKLLGTLQDPAGNPIVNVGLWALQFGGGGSGGFPTTLYFTAGIPAGGGIQTHGLFGSITTTAPPVVTTAGIVNGASFLAGPNGLAPGSIAAIFGANLTDNGSSCLPPACTPAFRSDSRLNATMAGAQVEINGTPAPMFYASPVQLGIQIPADLPAGSQATLQVTVDGQSSPPANISIGDVSPGIFTTGAAGAGVITHANGTLVNAASPAVPGETVILYATGLGQVNPFVPTGELPKDSATTVATPIVMIDSMQAEMKFSGIASCCVGLNQINVVVPLNVHPGTNVPVVLSVGERQSNTVMMPTKASN